MSRVGKNPVPIPAGVTIDLKGQHLKAKGKRGELQLLVHDDVSVAKEGEGDVERVRRDPPQSRSGQLGLAPSRDLLADQVGIVVHVKDLQARRP